MASDYFVVAGGVVNEFLEAVAGGRTAVHQMRSGLADLIRQEREQAFDAGASARCKVERDRSASGVRAFAAARLLAIEGRSEEASDAE